MKKKIDEEKKSVEIENKKQIKNQEKQLIVVFLIVGLLIATTAFFIYGFNHKEIIRYENTKFTTIKEGQLTLYQTSVPVVYNGNKVPYNFYLRTNPDELKKIEFNGTINFLPNMVINLTDFDCNGDQTIAIANLLSQYQVMGTKVIKDESAGCDLFERYLYLSITAGDETKVVQDSETCYTVYVNNCEILPATEKLMAENFVALNNKLSEEN